MKKTIWQRLYEESEDVVSGAITFGNITLPIQAGDALPKKANNNPRPSRASAPLIQGVLTLAAAKVEKCGFEASGQDSYIVHWECPDLPKGKNTIYARANFKTRTLETTNADYELISFAAMGSGAGIRCGSPTYKDAWISFIGAATRFAVTNANNVASKVVTADAIGELSDIYYCSLRFGADWPAKMPDDTKNCMDDWTIKTVPVDALKNIPFTNIRNSLGTVDDFETIMEIQEVSGEKSVRTRFQGPQLAMVMDFMTRKKHTALLGPPGTGKSLCGFEAFRLLGFPTKGADYQLFTCHEEVKASDLIGAFQPDGKGGFTWVDGPLVRAMTAHGGKGQPMLVEEFTRMPTKSQNIFISALSDGYIVRNEKPDAEGRGELVLAGPDFVLLADMNVDAAVDDIDLYGAAFARRVRKIEFSYPQPETLANILRAETQCSSGVAMAASKVYSHVMKVFMAHDVAHPINPGSAVQWIEDYLACTANGMAEREAAQQAAKHTWLRDVCGVDEKLRNSILNEIEGSFRALGAANAKRASRTAGTAN